MYLEHDMNVPWPALLGWAADTPILEQYGFQRGFYRVEPSEETGLAALTDQISRVNITEYKARLRFRVLDEAGRIKVCHHPKSWQKTLTFLYIAYLISGGTVGKGRDVQYPTR